jgi:hypothetical protein
MLQSLRRRLGGLAESVVRFPVTVAFLIAAAVMTAVSISGKDALERYIMTCAVGAVACAAGQSAYERFFIGGFRRIIMAAAGLVLALLFFLTVRALPENGPELLVRLAVTMLALFIAFVWVGVIRSRYGFDESFMAAFKALVQAVFFSGILFLGCVAIIAAVDTLITPVHEDAFMHTANIAFVIIAPLILLSLMPVYPGRAAGGVFDDGQELLIKKRAGSPKFLEVLLSYIVIPLTAVFTVILLIYIFLNIGGSFWTDNLLEPMLIAYSVTVILVMLLVSRLDNRPAVLFRRIFPKVLIPIALFQVIASLLLLSETGVTYGRYFVILYGIFAVFSGAVFSMKPAGKSGVIALALIILSAVSLIPPLDAFSVSRESQIAALETTLEKNGMLQSGIVTPDGSIPEEDQTRIIAAVRYLTETEELDTVDWLPTGFNGYDDAVFLKTFGFQMYSPAVPEPAYISVYSDWNGVIPVSGYDILLQVSLPASGKPGGVLSTFELNGATYELSADTNSKDEAIAVRDNAGQELIRFDTGDIFARYASYPNDKNLLTLDEATFITENALAALKITVLNAGFSKTTAIADINAQLYVLIDIK